MIDVEGIKKRLRELYGLSWFTEEQVDKLAKYLAFAGVSQPLLLNYSGHMASFLSTPASAGHHLAVKGGLAIHSMNVTDRLLQLSGDLKIAWSNSGSPYIIGMCHDLCKMRAYEENPEYTNSFRKATPIFPGHGTLSAMLAPEFLGHPISYVEQVCIVYHMGAWNIGKEYDANQLGTGISEFPLEVIATHTADMLASQYDEVLTIGA
jgi:hypothetical protein